MTEVPGDENQLGTAHVDDAVWAITDAVGHVKDASPGFAKLLNLSRRGVLGRSLTMFFVENRPELLSQLMRAAEGLPVQRVTTVHPRDRRPRQVRIEVRAMADAPGARVRLRWTMTPTERERPES